MVVSVTVQRRRLAAALVCAALSWACVPLTFSREEAVDFDVYRSVAVEVFVNGDAAYYGGQNATDYLVHELRSDSGFERVTGDVTETVDLILTVQVSSVEIVTYDSDTPELEYRAEARFRAVDQMGKLVDSGAVSDGSAFPDEAVEDALDEVSLHYLRPYRL